MSEGHQLALTCWKSVKVQTLEVVGNEVVKLLLGLAGDELLDQGDTIGERNVFEHLTPKCPLADRFQTLTQRTEISFSVQT